MKHKRSQTHLSGTTPKPTRIETLTLRLQADDTWQLPFSEEERVLCLEFARRYWQLQAKAGLDLEDAYRRVVAMLQMATNFELAEAGVATLMVESVPCQGETLVDSQGREVMVRCGRKRETVKL